MTKADLLDQFYENMATMKRAMHSKLGAQVGKLELSHGQMALLFTLSKYEPVNPKRLASLMYLTAGAVSQMVDSLVERKLVDRMTDPADRRSQILRLSRAGKSKLRQIEKHRHKFLKSVLEDLSAEELATLLKFQQKIIEEFSPKKDKLSKSK